MTDFKPKIIGIKRKDGGVSIMKILKDVNVEQEVKAAVGFDMVSYTEINAIPEDRDFRGAWDLKGKEVIVDLEKAKDIHLRRAQSAVDLELGKLDKVVSRDNEAAPHLDDYQKEAAKKKQELRGKRNIDVSKAKNLEELKKIWPLEE